jgi:hypothetical protein
MWLGVNLRTGTLVDMFEGDWTTCSTYVNYLRLNSQHDWGDLDDLLMSNRIISIIRHKVFIWAHNSNGYGHNLDMAIACFISFGKWVQRKINPSQAHLSYSSQRAATM